MALVGALAGLIAVLLPFFGGRAPFELDGRRFHTQAVLPAALALLVAAVALAAPAGRRGRAAAPALVLLGGLAAGLPALAFALDPHLRGAFLGRIGAGVPLALAAAVAVAAAGAAIGAPRSRGRAAGVLGLAGGALVAASAPLDWWRFVGGGAFDGAELRAGWWLCAAGAGAGVASALAPVLRARGTARAAGAVETAAGALAGLTAGLATAAATIGIPVEAAVRPDLSFTLGPGIVLPLVGAALLAAACVVSWATAGVD